MDMKCSLQKAKIVVAIDVADVVMLLNIFSTPIQNVIAIVVVYLFQKIAALIFVVKVNDIISDAQDSQKEFVFRNIERSNEFNKIYKINHFSICRSSVYIMFC